MEGRSRKRCYPHVSGDSMHMRAIQGAACTGHQALVAVARARYLPAEHLRVLPARTRPSLFGGD